mmetsp:Transcript_23077/g.57975  ORF Transcript_23077/g.57975 Transcript_23077/m.57975 type:complete len:267 (+) Transcript_23077:96-896(+)
MPRAEVARHMYVSFISPLRLLVNRLAYTALVAPVGTWSVAFHFLAARSAPGRAAGASAGTPPPRPPVAIGTVTGGRPPFSLRFLSFFALAASRSTTSASRSASTSSLGGFSGIQSPAAGLYPTCSSTAGPNCFSAFSDTTVPHLRSTAKRARPLASTPVTGQTKGAACCAWKVAWLAVALLFCSNAGLGVSLRSISDLAVMCDSSLGRLLLISASSTASLLYTEPRRSVQHGGLSGAPDRRQLSHSARRSSAGSTFSCFLGAYISR